MENDRAVRAAAGSHCFPARFLKKAAEIRKTGVSVEKKALTFRERRIIIYQVKTKRLSAGIPGWEQFPVQPTRAALSATGQYRGEGIRGAGFQAAA